MCIRDRAYFSAYVVISLIAPRSSNHVTGDLTARDPVSGLPDSKSSSHLETGDMIAPPVLFEVPLLHQFIKNINWCTEDKNLLQQQIFRFYRRCMWPPIWCQILLGEGWGVGRWGVCVLHRLNLIIQMNLWEEKFRKWTHFHNSIFAESLRNVQIGGR